MKRQFLHDDFLLETAEARSLYHSFAAQLPIIDYHNHLQPKDIAEDRRYANMAEIWLAGDHYKWRAMRAAGVDERYITGNASDWEKFSAWAATVPKTLRNPLYHWTHMELHRPFGIGDLLLGPDTARDVWEKCNELLGTPEFTAQGILRAMNVEIICTTDDPADDLRYHEMLASSGEGTPEMLPTFRPDRVLAIDDPPAFLRYLRTLGAAAGVDIRAWEDLLAALRKRHEYFHAHGCRLSDHGHETVFAADFTAQEAAAAFRTLLHGKSPEPARALSFRSALAVELALMDWEKGWAQMFHLGALRGANTRMGRLLGSDAGFDAIGDAPLGGALARFLDRLDEHDRLAKTVLFNLNPRDNELLAAMIGSFQSGPAPGKMQFGPAWWFLDQLDGMTRQIEALSAMGLLSQFVGMLTDSRSILSFPRHEYFRRLLCNILGADMHRGLIPDDMDLVGAMVRDISYHNARRYFAFPATRGKRHHAAASQP